jgi:hypothetical protein
LPTSLPPNGAASGDLSGTYPSPTVAKLQGTIVLSGTPSAGQVLTATSGVAADWQTPGSVTSVTMGGDVTGNSATSTVIKINGATVPVSGSLVTGSVLQVSGAAALTYAAVNLAGGSAFVTGTLPAGNLPSLAGDATGTITANTVVAIQARSISTSAPSNGQVLTWVSGSSMWTPSTPSGTISVTGSGFWHNTSGALDAAASVGSVAAQLPFTNAAVTDITWASVTQDISFSASVMGQATVTGLKGNSVPTLAAGYLQWTGSAFAWTSPRLWCSQRLGFVAFFLWHAQRIGLHRHSRSNCGHQFWGY